MLLKISNTKAYIQISPKWCAGTTNTKKRNRKMLQAALDRAQAKNKNLPFQSLSHSRQVGGFALADKPIGFDLESKPREISEKATRWFSRPAELKAVKSSLILWVMKEAAFKALRGPNQPENLRQIKITNARRVSQNEKIEFSFQVTGGKRSRSRGRGLAISNSRTIMGIAVVLT